MVELSDVLNQLPIHTDRPDRVRFRNPNGVYMKLCNFLALDPTYHGKGLERGGRLEQQIWNDFHNDPIELRRLANSIRAGYQRIMADGVIGRPLMVRRIAATHRQIDGCGGLSPLRCS